MKAADLLLNQLYMFHSDGSNEGHLQRIITIPTSAIGSLRRELVDTIGMERTKGFLFRHGWHCGMNDAVMMMEKDWDNDKELLHAGPKMHTLHGYVEVEVQMDEIDIAKGQLHCEGYWRHSYEAEEYIKLYGLSDQPVCHTTVGFASGYLSTIMGKKVLARELQCKAMGAEQCQWVSRIIEDWNDQDVKELRYYEPNYIIDELEQAYEKLKGERDNLNKTYHVHEKLTKEILRGHNLNSIAHVLNKSTMMPVLIEDIDCNLLAVGGIDRKEALRYSADLKNRISKQGVQQKRGFQPIDKTLLLDTSFHHKRVITPIYLSQKIIGYCSFLYHEDVLQEVDKIILERASTVCSLYLLNERTRFHADQLIIGNFLEDLFMNRIGETEIAKRAHYVGFKLIEPYFMISLKRTVHCLSFKEELVFNDQLMNDLSRFFKERDLNVLFQQRSGNIVIFLSEDVLVTNHLNKEEFSRKLLHYCSAKYPQFPFFMGISSSSPSIEDVSMLYEECLASLKFANRHQNMIFFDSLGVLGLIFKNNDQRGIKNFAHKLLGSLIKEDKNMELTKTLYHYLNQGCSIHKTARAMNLSISGLRYRLDRLHDLLPSELNSTDTRNQTLLAIRCLMILGELDIDGD